MDKLRRTLTGSVTSALGALLMIGAIAFGSTVIRPMTANLFEPEPSTAQADAGSAGTDAGSTEPAPLAAADLCTQNEQGQCVEDQPEEFPDWQPPAEKPTEEPTEQPKDEPKDKPTDNPAPNPAPSANLTLAAVFNADLGKIVVEWSAFGGDFEKYKLVRSTDANATWPLGDGDTLVDVVGAGGERRFVDYNAPCNTELHYRAFAVRHGETGYVVLASSNVGAATRACDAPPADPKALGFELMRTADGVQLNWGACGSDAFAVYKVVRSATNASPMYPLNDGTELIGVIGDAGTTGFVDSNVQVGQTWTYRVLCMGQNGGGWYVLGLTDALTLTVE